MTDAYQPIERELRLTCGAGGAERGIAPLAIVTKGSGVERDLDVLAPMGAGTLLRCTSLSPRSMQGWHASWNPRRRPHRRLRTIRTLAEAGGCQWA